MISNDFAIQQICSCFCFHHEILHHITHSCFHLSIHHVSQLYFIFLFCLFHKPCKNDLSLLLVPHFCPQNDCHFHNSIPPHSTQILPILPPPITAFLPLVHNLSILFTSFATHFLHQCPLTGHPFPSLQYSHPHPPICHPELPVLSYAKPLPLRKSH